MSNLQDLEGEILDRRYAVLERTGPDRFRVYDMQTLKHLELRVQVTAAGIVHGPVATPPPIPPVAAVAPKPAPSAMDQLEEAWFAVGDELESAESAEVADYSAYQAELEEIAARLRGRRIVGTSLLRKDRWAIFVVPQPA
jgi:hypothetical protein